MSTTHLPRRSFLTALVLSLAWATVVVPGAPAEKQEPPPPPKKVKVGKNVFLEVQGPKRRVLVNAYVCLRKGMLEQLMTRRRTKEHEAILAADVDARDIHTALLIAGAKVGSTVQFKKVGDNYVVIPPKGTPIKVTLQYLDKNKKLVTVPAQRWVYDVKNKKDLAHDWVFAGSNFFRDPFDPKKAPLYGANDGDVICVSNFDTAMLDLPINSSSHNDELAFEARTERIPPLDTPVTVILEPILKKK